MYSKILALLIVVVVLVGVAAGCGGGGQQGAKSQGSEQKKGQTTGKGKMGKGSETKTESLEGTVARVLPDKNTVVVRPKEGEPVPFRYRAENLQVKLNGQEAKPEAIEKGQRASVEYVTRTTKKNRKVNVARTIELQPKGGGKTSG